MIPIPNLSLRAIVALAGGLIAAALLTFLVLDRNHWKHVATERQTQLVEAQAAFDQTVASYRAAAAQAKAADAANAARVQANQAAISSDTEKSYEDRIAAARAESQRLRFQQATAIHSGSRPGTPVSGLPAAACGPAQGAGEDGLSDDDKLIATEQAIQLDELIKWVRKQAAVPVNGTPER